MILTRQELHDTITDLERIKDKAAPATHRVLRALHETYLDMDVYAIGEVIVRRKRTNVEPPDIRRP
jgi:hypothetical protein